MYEILVLFVLLILILVAIYFLRKAMRYTTDKVRKNNKVQKKTYKRKVGFRTTRKNIQKAFSKYLLPLLIETKNLKFKKFAIIDKIKAKGDITEDVKVYNETVSQLRKKRNKAANKVFKVANESIKYINVMDLHGLLVSDAIQIAVTKLRMLQTNPKVKVVTFSCGVGKHNSIGVSMILKSLVRYLINNGVPFYKNVNNGFVSVQIAKYEGTFPTKETIRKITPDYIEKLKSRFVEEESEDNEEDVDYGQSDDEYELALEGVDDKVEKNENEEMNEEENNKFGEDVDTDNLEDGYTFS
ncbi:hypothetical protein EIN_118350 [Entamoeba invadens IP1]|uniref:Smr domain-containing protein n=1 Tax=Entamoeba invadens IP1 TaxID=370355 RepID=L7FNR4_ENTIV|nr:hypothetical protein EIN_118350 [Entamoeba invadens IP1]ELP92261.1 hypothetical protein EIN_118350 [Entamoeba invadens IP1]|eukprot:XP_004259032.1 hypothetical protein EIN_118350 [Entamoeba invadens IP1]